MGLTRKILPRYEDKRVKAIVIISLIVSILITNSLILFSPDDDSRFYFSGLTSTLTLGVALAVSIVMVYEYKRNIRLEKKEKALSQHSDDTKSHHYYYDNNKIHLSICLFLLFWLVASINWTFEDQEAPGILIADVLYYLGYASFGYFLYSLYYHFFRKEFEPFVLILISLIFLVPLIILVDILVSTTRLLSTQTLDISVVIVNVAYPILDAILIFPIAIIFWTISSRKTKHKDDTNEEQEIKEKDKPTSSSFVYGSAFMWILFLFIAMVLSAAGDIGFVYTSAYDVTTVQNSIWIWNILYNSDHLCLAAALIGYKYFFSFSKIDAPR
jgi:small-conductance mechanosensitive channel